MTLGVVNGVLEATRYLPQVYSSYVNKGSGSLSYVRFFLCIGGGLGATIQKLVLGAFYTLVPIRPRSRGERRSLRTFAVVPLRPGSLAFDPDTPRRLSTPLLTPFNSTPISSLVWATTLRRPGEFDPEAGA